ncbi:hypothetical protein GN244_ATG06694 [Phytophthora infestans]|uniref:Uncharacterized protein n=1 Tax=Phytophthora infestans TaxID=4787 RepID=A0A833W3J9_PHYIN|nr:hypothetical protein GN244_ATG06694 [Phytophthora infestans]
MSPAVNRNARIRERLDDLVDQMDNCFAERVVKAALDAFKHGAELMEEKVVQGTGLWAPCKTSRLSNGSQRRYRHVHFDCSSLFAKHSEVLGLHCLIEDPAIDIEHYGYAVSDTYAVQQ